MDALAGDRHRLGMQIVNASMQLDCALTLQSISEFYAAATRKRLVSVEAARAQAQDWLTMFRTIPSSVGAVRTALDLASVGKASYWDALLTATAAEAGCSAILTEDLADGAVLNGLRIINPFAGSTLSPAAAKLLATE